MSKEYEYFKVKTIKAVQTILDANKMRALSDEYLDGFSTAMYEAREIFMRMEDDLAPAVEDIAPKDKEQL